MIWAYWWIRFRYVVRKGMVLGQHCEQRYGSGNMYNFDENEYTSMVRRCLYWKVMGHKHGMVIQDLEKICFL